MEIRPAMVFIQQGNPKDITHKLVHIADGSWWVHGFIAVTPTLAVEATLPILTDLDSGTVQIVNIQERLDIIKAYGGSVVVMDLPNITDVERQHVADAALSFVGWKYGWLNCIFFFVFRMWLRTTRKELNCSFLMARAFRDGIQRNIFTNNTLTKLPRRDWYRRRDLCDGLCTPGEVFRYSELQEIYRYKW